MIYAVGNHFAYRFQEFSGPLADQFFAVLMTSTLIGLFFPFLTDRVVRPALLRGIFRWLAGHHPKYSYLKT